MSYFTNVNNLQELKTKFRKLSMDLHPDKGGSKKAFQNMLNEYQGLFKRLLNNSDFSEERKVYETEADKNMRAVINQIIHLPGIELEIIGSWLWVTGNTYEHKDELKKSGLFFAPKKKAWYWRPAKYKKKSKKQFELVDLRSMYGAAKVESNTKQLVS